MCGSCDAQDETEYCSGLRRCNDHCDNVRQEDTVKHIRKDRDSTVRSDTRLRWNCRSPVVRGLRMKQTTDSDFVPEMSVWLMRNRWPKVQSPPKAAM